MRRTERGATLIEVVLALAILAGGLTIILSSSYRNMRVTTFDRSLGVAVDLARGKIYDLEETLLREGFQDTDQTLEGDFSDEGWPDYSWSATIEIVELTATAADLQTAQGQAQQTDPTAGIGATGPGATPGGALGGLLGLGGGAEGADGTDATGAFLGAQFELMKEVLKAAIRKVTLKVTWTPRFDSEQSFEAVVYFTAPAAINKVISGGGEPDPQSPPPP